MSDRAQETVLGYLLGALDDSEMEEVAVRLESDPVYQRQLLEVRRRLAPLQVLENEVAEYRPPQGLAARTCDYVFAHAPRPQPAAERRLSPCAAAPVRGSRVRWIDAVAAAVVFILASAVIWPALRDSRFQARLATCQDNLRELGVALTSYSRAHDDRLPAVPTEGRLAAAGVYAPVLVSEGYLTESRRVLCPEAPQTAGRDFQIPTVEEFQSVGEKEAARLRRQMGGSYGYCIGHLERGLLLPTKNLGRNYFAIMADAPSDELADHQSLNHGGRGQNVLFEDGHVEFVTSSQPAGSSDDIFCNDHRLVAAGIHRDDSVIAGSGTAPIVFVNR
jgi:hypothetical protein